MLKDDIKQEEKNQTFGPWLLNLSFTRGIFFVAHAGESQLILKVDIRESFGSCGGRHWQNQVHPLHDGKGEILSTVCQHPVSPLVISSISNLGKYTICIANIGNDKGIKIAKHLEFVENFIIHSGR